MTDLKRCPCGAPARASAYDVDGCCNYQDKGYIECTKCSMRATDEEDWNTRPVPELPEGYRESDVVLLHPDGGALASRQEKSGIVFLHTDILDRNDQAALAIWLQRRSNA